MNTKTVILFNNVYRHFKGGLYISKYYAKHSETLEELVVYQNCDTGEFWARPSEMFTDTKEVDGQTINRFEPVIFKTEEGA